MMSAGRAAESAPTPIAALACWNHALGFPAAAPSHAPKRRAASGAADVLIGRMAWAVSHSAAGNFPPPLGDFRDIVLR